MKKVVFYGSLFLSIFTSAVSAETAGGWVKSPASPVLGGKLGVCFDISMLREDGMYKMWFSWRPKKAIAYTESRDGETWKEPVVVLTPAGAWEMDLNRPGVIRKDGIYHMWYTGQAGGKSRIGYAVSENGIHWKRATQEPVLVASQEWEKVAVMCPHVLWDEKIRLFQMWYSAGEQYEPNAIGYATSPDGIRWTKRSDNPVFAPDKTKKWEQQKVTAAQILRHGPYYYMFYIGFENINLARIGIARSLDGISGWERLPANPIISPDAGKWDGEACYKPFVIYDETEKKWRLWYNGRKGYVEQIGLAIHEGESLF